MIIYTETIYNNPLEKLPMNSEVIDISDRDLKVNMNMEIGGSAQPLYSNHPEIYGKVKIRANKVLNDEAMELHFKLSSMLPDWNKKLTLIFKIELRDESFIEFSQDFHIKNPKCLQSTLKTKIQHLFLRIQKDDRLFVDANTYFTAGIEDILTIVSHYIGHETNMGIEHILNFDVLFTKDKNYAMSIKIKFFKGLICITITLDMECIKGFNVLGQRLLDCIKQIEVANNLEVGSLSL